MRIVFAAILILASLAAPAPVVVTIHAARVGDIVTLTIHATLQSADSVHLDALLPDGTEPITQTIDGGICNAFGCNADALAGVPVVMTETVRLLRPGTFTFDALATSPIGIAQDSATISVFYPYTVSLSTAEAEPGQVVIATISAPSGSAVSLEAPAFIAVGPIHFYGGNSDTYSATLTIADDAPMAREPITIGLRVDGVLVSTAHLRIHTQAVIPLRYTWLPLVAQRSS